MSSNAVSTLRHAASAAYIVLDDDRITHVSAPLHDDLGHRVGHILWDHLPGARRVYEPTLDEARSTRRWAAARSADSTSAIGEAHALAASLAALVALGQEERAAPARQLVPEEPAAELHSSGPTFTSIFPMFSPRSRPRNAFGAFSIPSTTVSR